MMERYIIEWCVLVYLVVISILLYTGKGGLFIAIYNALSRQEQDKYNKKVFYKGIARFYAVCAMATLIGFLGDFFKYTFLFYLTLVIVLLAVVVLNLWMAFSKNLKNRSADIK